MHARPETPSLKTRVCAAMESFKVHNFNCYTLQFVMNRKNRTDNYYVAAKFTFLSVNMLDIPRIDLSAEMPNSYANYAKSRIVLLIDRDKMFIPE